MMKHPFRQPCSGRLGALNPFHDQRSGGASEQLVLAEAVNMRVVPVQPRRFVVWNTKPVFKRSIARLYRSLQYIVLMTDRRNGEPMKMQIGRDRAHDAAGAGIIRRLHVHLRMCHPRASGLQRPQLIREVQDNQVTRMDPQIRRFVTGGIDVAVADGPIHVGGIIRGQPSLKHAILAAQLCPVHRPCCRPPAAGKR